MFFSALLHPSPSLTFSLALQIYAHESKLVDYWVQEPNAVERNATTTRREATAKMDS